MWKALTYTVAAIVGLAGAAYGLKRDVAILLAVAAVVAISAIEWLWNKLRKRGSAPSSAEGLATVSSPIPAPVVQDSSARKVQYFVLGLVGIGSVAVISSNFWDNTTEVTPDHSAAVVYGMLGVALVSAIVTFALTFKVTLKPNMPRWASSLALSVCAGLIFGLVAMFSIDKVFEIHDFPTDEAVQSIAYLPIARAYRSGSDYNDYNIQLAGPFANLEIDPNDYKAAFNNAENVYPEDYCLRAKIERAGLAMRIMHSSAKPFPAGSVIRCPTRQG